MSSRPIEIRLGEKAGEISPLLYGVFFEDINYGADGGLYGELLKNRSFEFFSLEGTEDKRLSGWIPEPGLPARLAVETDRPLTGAHQNYLRLTVPRDQNHPRGGVRNLGPLDGGFAVRESEDYRFSVWARTPGSPLTVWASIKAPTGEVIGSAALTIEGGEWTHYEVLVHAHRSLADAVFSLVLEGPGTVDLELVSLFPVNTYGARVNGLRADLVQALKDLQPKFLRFPGGCIVEGRTFENMYRWKQTIGDVSERKTQWNRWQLDEYQRPGCSSADYFQSNGLGFYEYFLLCEDLGAEPLPVLNCGMTCQWHEGLLVPLDELDEFVQDALDLVEFANGDVSTPWGQRRADLGHPAPFGLKFLGIGNEQWNEVYFERYEVFHRALKARYPEIQLITSSGPGVDDEYFAKAQKWMSETDCRADLVDEHYYRSPEWFHQNVDRYDGYDRNLPRVFLGEYACHTADRVEDRRNNWRAALAEAALLTGVERNSDHVVMACYAPLFGRTGHHQWGPNLLWFNSTDVYGTPSYYVQKLFSTNLGRWRVDAQFDHPDLKVAASLTDDATQLLMKVVNVSTQPVEARLNPGVGGLGGGWREVLGCADLETVNSHENPLAVAPRRMPVAPGTREFRFEGQSLTVLRLTILP